MRKLSRTKPRKDCVTRGAAVTIYVDGQPVTAYQGETIAAALLNEGIRATRSINQQPMGIYCNMGICFSCAMTVDGIANVRICRTLVSDGCQVETQHFSKVEANG
jgi:predicted molibdopterin-dependent oxidoreductase YjgC